MTQRQCFHRHVAATALLIQNRSHLPKALIGGANLLSSNHLQTLHADTPSTESSTRVLSQTVSNMIHSLSDEPLGYRAYNLSRVKRGEGGSDVQSRWFVVSVWVWCLQLACLASCRSAADRYDPSRHACRSRQRRRDARGWQRRPC